MKKMLLPLMAAVLLVSGCGILSGETKKDNLWNVNTEKEYHEEKQGSR